jgi:ubiquinone/menaquinone biosynthesis C-methylase UbiE
MDIFFELHTNLPREGPGDNESTKRALSYLKALPKDPLIVDVGCGPGMQTIQLAKLIDGKIIALDTHQPYLDVLNAQAKKHNVEQRIKTLNHSMFDLPFEENSIDVIWSESSIYIYGFKGALRDWKQLLKEGGYFVASELSWVKNNPPSECLEFWNREYPQMLSIEENLKIIKNLNYILISYFEIPKNSWMENYYSPLKKKIKSLQNKYKKKRAILATLEKEMEEIRIFKKYNSYYGYVFYIMQKNNFKKD